MFFESFQLTGGLFVSGIPCFLWIVLKASRGGMFSFFEGLFEGKISFDVCVDDFLGPHGSEASYAGHPLGFPANRFLAPVGGG